MTQKLKNQSNPNGEYVIIKYGGRVLWDDVNEVKEFRVIFLKAMPTYDRPENIDDTVIKQVGCRNGFPC